MDCKKLKPVRYGLYWLCKNCGREVNHKWNKPSHAKKNLFGDPNPRTVFFWQKEGVVWRLVK